MSSTKRQKRKGPITFIVFFTYVLFQTVTFKTEWKFKEYGDGYILRSYKQAYDDNTTEISVPARYEGKNVVAIDDKAFYKNTKIKKVTIPDTVTELGASVFKECENLETVTLSKNLLFMGGECFKDCKSLTSIVLPDSLTELRGEAFMGCSSLKEVVLPKNITEIKGNTFENCTSLESIEIPSGVTRIAAHAFYGCSSLSYVFVPDTVTEIGSSAFRKCDSLESIELPDGVEINERAFKESPTNVLTKILPDEEMLEAQAMAYTNFDTYVLYSVKRGEDEIFCYFEDTLVLTTSEKFREAHIASDNLDLLLIEEHDDIINYLQKAKESGVKKVVFYAYSETISEHVNGPYFFVNEWEIDDFMNNIEPAEEE